MSQAIQSLYDKAADGRSPVGKTVCITFDDGCETDLLAAAPILKEFGFGATFYITVGFLGKPGYLSEAQVRNLSALGFEIGCHSLTHPYLPTLTIVAFTTRPPERRIGWNRSPAPPSNIFRVPADAGTIASSKP